jgi:hypothetical protein
MAAASSRCRRRGFSREHDFARDRAARPYRLAADLLTGADPYGGEFLMAFRAGELG